MNSNTPRQITLEHATLETGIELERVVVDYQTWGAPNAEESNVAVVLPALTGTTNAADWWGGIVGPGKYINTDTMFVICPRIRYEAIASIRTNSSPELAKAQPLLTTRDAANIYNCALDAIGIGTIRTIIGGSMGGQMALEWAVQQPHRFANIVIIAANALPSAWGIAIRAAQRMAIEADPTFGTDVPNAGGRGLAAARAIGMVSYRSYDDFKQKQTNADNRIQGFSAESYQRYQGSKLANRFRADVYYMLTRTMDSHDVGRDRGGVQAALATITARAAIVGIDQDILMPTHEQKYLVEHIPNSTYLEMQSTVGHDAFLADQHQLSTLLFSTKH